LGVSGAAGGGEVTSASLTALRLVEWVTPIRAS
jgi:hypothetical protein